MSVPVEFVNDRGNKVEIKDTEARRLAGVAQTAAENAQSTAGGANTLAQQAKDKADTAYTDAGTAQSTATAAGTLAQQAKDIADAASSAASTNAENISTLNGKVTALEGSISDIEEDIETIKEDYISKEELQPYDMLEETDNLPLTFTTNGESLIDYKIYGNSNSNHIDEVTNNLPITIPNAKAGIVEDWTIEGNNIPQVENITKELPITFPSNGDNITDYTIYGNNNPSQPEPEGVLPLSFTTAETVLRDWQIDGNNNPNYVETTSVLPLSFTTQTAENVSDWSISGNNNIGKNVVNLAGILAKSTGNVTLTPDVVTGMITATTSDGQAATAECVMQIYLPENIEGNYYLSGCPEGGDSARTYDIYPWDETLSARPKQWDGVTVAVSSTENTPVEVKFIAGHVYRLGIRVRANQNINGLIFRPMLRPADTSATFEPYQIGVGQKKITVIANTDLEQGHTDTDTSKTYEQNKTSSTNRLRISSLITVNGAVSNIISISDGFEFAIRWYSNGLYAASTGWNTDYTIPANFTYNSFGLTIRKPDNSDITNAESITITIQEQTYSIPLNVNNTIQDIYIGSTPLTAGQSVSKTSTDINIAAQVGTNTITTDLFNKPEMYVKALDYTGIGERTKNLLEITAETQTINDVTFTVDKTSGTITLNGDTSQQTTGFSFVVATRTDLDGTYLLSGGADGGSSASYDLYMYDAFDQRFSERCYDSDDVITFNCVAGHTTKIYIQCRKNYNYDNVIFKPMLRAADTSADFIPYGYQIPLAVQGKNLLEITATSTTINGVTFTVDKTAGTITANGTASANARFDFCTTEMTVNATDIINGIPDGATSSTYYILAEFENGTNAFGSNLDNTAIGDRPNFTPKVLNWRIYVISGQTVNNLVFKPMIRLADTSTNFVPYFHKDYTFYIGDTPLTEGENISKTSTGIDIETQVGENTISTTLYNKPVMYCGKALGVGIPTENKMPAPANGVYSANRTTVTVTDGVYHIVQTEGSGSSSVYIDLPEFEVPDSGYINYLNSMAFGTTAVVLRYNGASLSGGYALTPINRAVAIGSDYAGKKVNQIQIYTTGNVAMDFTIAPMITDSNTYTSYVPYGYKVPITITDENSNTTEQTFYIGNSRLLSGDTYTKTQAGIHKQE